MIVGWSVLLIYTFKLKYMKTFLVASGIFL